MPLPVLTDAQFQPVALRSLVKSSPLQALFVEEDFLGGHGINCMRGLLCCKAIWNGLLHCSCHVACSVARLYNCWPPTSVCRMLCRSAASQRARLDNRGIPAHFPALPLLPRRRGGNGFVDRCLGRTAMALHVFQRSDDGICVCSLDFLHCLDKQI